MSTRGASAGPGRRRFLVLSAGVALGALPGCASLASVMVVPTDGRVRLAPGDHPGLAGDEGFLRVRPEGWDLPLYVLREEGGAFQALSPVCTHLGCVVEVEGRGLVCPCHGSSYDRLGRVVRGPAERALRSFPVRVEADGTLVIDVRAGEA